MEIRKFVDVSTAHIQQADVRALERLSRSGQYSGLLEGPCGFFIWTGYHDESAFPQTVRNVLKWAHDEKSIDYVMFDQDADSVEGLIEYDYG